MDAEAAARAWVDGWSRAWPARDAAAIAALYTDGAPYLSHPFRERTTAYEYASRAFEDEDVITFQFGEPIACGNRAAVEYWAVLRDRDGQDVTIAGTSVLRFAADGRVEEHRDYWAMEDGRRPPPAGWGR